MRRFLDHFAQTIDRSERSISRGGECREPRAGCGTTPGAPELQTHIRQTALKASVAGDIGPIAQHGSNNLVGGWGAAVCLTAEE
jgi:hypothetical protein